MKGESGIDSNVRGPKGEIGNPGQQVCLCSSINYLFWVSVP